MLTLTILVYSTLCSTAYKMYIFTNTIFMKNKYNSKISNKAKKRVLGPINPNIFDPLGSYTGVSLVDDTPTQDADDI